MIKKIQLHNKNKTRFPLFRGKDCVVSYPIFASPSFKEWAVGCPTFAHPSMVWTSTWLFSSPWTTSSSDKTIYVADHPNSEFWQRIGQPYARNPGRCFVAVVDIEADRCAVCLAELDAVQSEADRQANVRCPTPFWSGRMAGNKQSPDNAASQTKLFHVKHSY